MAERLTPYESLHILQPERVVLASQQRHSIGGVRHTPDTGFDANVPIEETVYTSGNGKKTSAKSRWQSAIGRMLLRMKKQRVKKLDMEKSAGHGFDAYEVIPSPTLQRQQNPDDAAAAGTCDLESSSGDLQMTYTRSIAPARESRQYANVARREGRPVDSVVPQHPVEKFRDPASQTLPLGEPLHEVHDREAHHLSAYSERGSQTTGEGRHYTPPPDPQLAESPTQTRPTKSIARAEAQPIIYGSDSSEFATTEGTGIGTGMGADGTDPDLPDISSNRKEKDTTHGAIGGDEQPRAPVRAVLGRGDSGGRQPITKSMSAPKLFTALPTERHQEPFTEERDRDHSFRMSSSSFTADAQARHVETLSAACMARGEFVAAHEGLCQQRPAQLDPSTATRGVASVTVTAVARAPHCKSHKDEAAVVVSRARRSRSLSDCPATTDAHSGAEPTRQANSGRGMDEDVLRSLYRDRRPGEDPGSSSSEERTPPVSLHSDGSNEQPSSIHSLRPVQSIEMLEDDISPPPDTDQADPEATYVKKRLPSGKGVPAYAERRVPVGRDHRHGQTTDPARQDKRPPEGLPFLRYDQLEEDTPAEYESGDIPNYTRFYKEMPPQRESSTQPERHGRSAVQYQSPQRRVTRDGDAGVHYSSRTSENRAEPGYRVGSRRWDAPTPGPAPAPAPAPRSSRGLYTYVGEESETYKRTADSTRLRHVTRNQGNNYGGYSEPHTTKIEFRANHEHATFETAGEVFKISGCAPGSPVSITCIRPAPESRRQNTPVSDGNYYFLPDNL